MLSFRSSIIFWGLAFLGFLALVWLFKGILLPFVLGIVVAYLLNPAVNGLGRWKCDRRAATIIILGGFLVVILGAAALAIPLLIRELSDLIDNLPALSQRAMDLIEPYQDKIMGMFGQTREEQVAKVAENKDVALNTLKTVLSGLMAGGAVLTSFISVIVIMPIVAFFMMIEWPSLVRWVKDLLPRQHEATILGLLKKMDRKIAGFIRGQMIVAALLGTIYAVALSLAGLKYGFLIGILAGAASIIPLVGSTLGLLAAIVMGWLQSGELSYVALVGGIFVAGQLIEGNIITPRIVGDSVGLHPLWIFFALMAGGALFGIVGMLIAVPVAAVISVLAGFLIEQYKKSPYYLGETKAKAGKKKVADA